jgi:hypothetical protein
MTEINQEADPAQTQSNAATPAESPEVVRQLVTPEVTKQIAQSDDDRSPGLDRDLTPQLTARPTSETEVIRELVVPQAKSTSQSDDDRSPGLDRDLTIKPKATEESK